MRNKYKVHQLNIKMAEEPGKLEQFLNNLEGEVVAIIPNVETFFLFYGAKVKFLLVIEKVS